MAKLIDLIMAIFHVSKLENGSRREKKHNNNKTKKKNNITTSRSTVDSKSAALANE